MLQVERKEEESLESLIRRFNKKVIQSGLMTAARRKKFYEKPLTKRAEREIAIRKRVRKEQKTREAYAIRG